MFLFPSLYVKKCDHHRCYFYPSNAIIEEFCLSLARDLRHLPNHVKKQHPRVPQKHQKLPSRCPNLKNLPKTEPNGRPQLQTSNTPKSAHEISTMQKWLVLFSEKKKISDSADILYFITWGGVHKPGDKKLVTLFDTKNMIHI